MATRYTYFVSYSHPRGFGNATIWLTQPVTSWDQISTMTADISGDAKTAGSIVILNFILLSTTPSEMWTEDESVDQ